jgi:uncharacterized protein (TIGR02300 family)
LTGRKAYGKARADEPTAAIAAAPHDRPIRRFFMVKPEWGTKRTCPKCSTRFYDLTKDEPVTCIACGASWNPEPILKSKQPLPFEAAVVAPEKVEADEDLAAEELVPDEDEEPSADEEVDLTTGEEDLGLATGGEDEEH